MDLEQDPKRAAALGMLQGPAIALMVTAGLGIAFQVLSVVRHLAGAAAPMAFPGMPDSQVRVFHLLAGPIGLASALLGLAIGVVVLLGALKMKEGRSYGFALASAILAMVPCISPCCCLGLPFGIWALIVLVKPEVKAAFQA